MQGLLDCKISKGQFRDEFAVSGESFDGTGFSLFVAREDLEIENEPNGEQAVSGKILVEILDQKDNLLLVRLPNQTLENGDSVTVRAPAVQREANA